MASGDGFLRIMRYFGLGLVIGSLASGMGLTLVGSLSLIIGATLLLSSYDSD